MKKFCCLILRILIFNWLILTVTGCLILPIPTPEHGGTGVLPESDDVLNKILKPGQTSRADVMLQWGTPSETFKDERFIAYDWERIVGYILWVVGYINGGIGGTEELKDPHYICLEFDAEGYLKQFRLFEINLSTWSDPHERMLEWIKSAN
jgi:hypothetical protein